MTEASSEPGPGAGPVQANAPGVDRELWEQVYHAYNDELIGYVVGKYGKQPDEAADLAQQAFLRFIALPNPRRVEEVRSYLFQVVRNLITDDYRKTAVRNGHAQYVQRTEESTQQLAPPPERSLLATEKLDRLQAIIEQLPSKRRRAFVLNRVHLLSYPEIAREMNISVDGVKKHVLRALETCQRELAAVFGEDAR